MPGQRRWLHDFRLIIQASGLAPAHMPVKEREQAMNRTMMKTLTTAVFAAGLMIGVGSTASAQVAGQACSPNGTSKSRVVGTIRHYFSCRNGKWVFVKMCPVGGGPCAEM